MKKALITLLAGIVAASAYFGMGLIAPSPISSMPEVAYGGFTPAGGITYYLQSSIGLTNTSITLTSFKNRSGIPLTMSVLNTDIAYATLDPQTTRSEFVSFTGVVQNANGTATLTGVTRGLADIYPFTASTTMRQSHSGQSVLILSDPPQLFNEYAAKRNNEWITGIWGFGSLPTTSVVCVNGNQFCNKDYIDAGLNAGAATSTFANIGLVMLANDKQVASSTASSTASGSTPAPLVIPSKFSTTTPGLLCNSGIWNCIPVAQVSGYISQAWIDLTSAASWAFQGAVNIAASASFRLTLNGQAYTFPTTQTASSTMLSTDGLGNLSWVRTPILLSNLPGVNQTTTSNASTTLLTVPIPANTLSATSSLQIKATFVHGGAGNACSYDIQIGTGSASTTIGNLSQTSNQSISIFDITLMATSTANIYSAGYGSNSVGTINGNFSAMTPFGSGVYTPYTTTALRYISFRARNDGGSVPCTLVGETILNLQN